MKTHARGRAAEIPLVTIWIVVIACLVAAVTDLRYRRIPNAIPISLACLAIAIVATHGVVPLLCALALGIGTLVLGTFAFARGWLGGGDVKLLAAVASSLAPADALAFFFYTSIAGGVLALVTAIAAGRLVATLRSMSALARPLVYKGVASLAPERPLKLPYALAIATGAIAVPVSHTFLPMMRLPL